MAQIIVAEHAGFCFGVRRAINLAEEAVKDTHLGGKVFSMG
ncbi:MAG: 4-hydroxy-3-methylbut-2-enyl diphosphate reductase, partial [Aquificaceae bacterium]